MVTLLILREGTITGMEVSRTTLPWTQKVTRLGVTKVRATIVRKLMELQAPKVSAVLAGAKDVENIQANLWELQRFLNNRVGSLSATYMKKRRSQHQSPRSQRKDHADVGHFGMIAPMEFANFWAHLDAAFREVSNCGALHDVTCCRFEEGKPQSQRYGPTHRERCRRTTKQHLKSEAAINHLERFGWLVKKKGQHHSRAHARRP